MKVAVGMTSMLIVLFRFHSRTETSVFRYLLPIRDTGFLGCFKILITLVRCQWHVIGYDLYDLVRFSNPIDSQ